MEKKKIIWSQNYDMTLEVMRCISFIDRKLGLTNLSPRTIYGQACGYYGWHVASSAATHLKRVWDKNYAKPEFLKKDIKIYEECYAPNFINA